MITPYYFQLLPCLWNFAKDSKTVSFIFWNNSLELVLSQLNCVLEWNAAPLASTSPLFRSTYSIVHETVNLILVCRLLIRRLVIDFLAWTRNKSGSIQSFPSIRYCILNFFNADSDSFNWKNVSLLLYSFLIRFLNDSRASSTTFGFTGV